jgi:carbamoyl-phosphate synthase large subunit
MKKINVLVTAASRRVPLVRAFRDAVEKFGKGRVITTDINPLSPALYLVTRHHIVPLTTTATTFQLSKASAMWKM